MVDKGSDAVSALPINLIDIVHSVIRKATLLPFFEILCHPSRTSNLHPLLVLPLQDIFAIYMGRVLIKPLLTG